MNPLKKLKDDGKISGSSKIKVTSFPPHSGNFFSGWYDVEVDGHKMQVYGSSPAQLGAWEAQDSVKNAIAAWLNGEKEFCPQARDK